MFKYEVEESGGGYYGSEDRRPPYIVTVQVSPVYDTGSYHKPLALALLDVLNGRSGGGCLVKGGVHVEFRDPKVKDAAYILASFRVYNADHEHIQELARQAQTWLTKAMSRAVRATEMVLAVTSVDPWKARMVGHPALDAACTSHVKAHRVGLHEEKS